MEDIQCPLQKDKRESKGEKTRKENSPDLKEDIGFHTKRANQELNRWRKEPRQTVRPILVEFQNSEDTEKISKAIGDQIGWPRELPAHLAASLDVRRQQNKAFQVVRISQLCMWISMLGHNEARGQNKTFSDMRAFLGPTPPSPLTLKRYFKTDSNRTKKLIIKHKAIDL